jgi:hypothetical protein
VARRAIHPLDRFVVVGMFRGDVGMTAGAGIRRMNRRREPGLVHKHGNFFASRSRFGQRFVVMTIQTERICQCSSRRRAKRNDYSAKQHSKSGNCSSTHNEHDCAARAEFLYLPWRLLRTFCAIAAAGLLDTAARRHKPCCTCHKVCASAFNAPAAWPLRR